MNTNDMKLSGKRIGQILALIVFLHFAIKFIAKYRFLYFNVAELNFLEDEEVAEGNTAPDAIPLLIHQTWKNLTLPQDIYQQEMEYTMWLQNRL